nr:MAG TPA: hypothetical protein [Caudoviricetes sp.]
MVNSVGRIEKLRCLKMRTFCWCGTFGKFRFRCRIVIHTVVVLIELESHERFHLSGDRVDIQAPVDEELRCVRIENQVSDMLRTKYHVKLVGNGQIQFLHLLQISGKVHETQSSAAVDNIPTGQHYRHIGTVPVCGCQLVQRMVADTDLESLVMLRTNGIALVVSQVTDFLVIHFCRGSIVFLPFEEYLFPAHRLRRKLRRVVHFEINVIDKLVVAYPVRISCFLRDTA